MYAPASSLSRFDAYQKSRAGGTEKSIRGGLVTIATVLAMVYLCAGEVSDFLETKVSDRLFVDTAYAHTFDTHVRVNLRVSFLAAPCADLHLDAENKKGVHDVTVATDLTKEPYHHHQQQQRNAAEERADPSSPPNPRTAPGCTINGTLVVHKSEAQLYIMGAVETPPLDLFPGGFDDTAHRDTLHARRAMRFNSSHIVEHLSFGLDFPGKVSPADGVVKIAAHGG